MIVNVDGAAVQLQSFGMTITGTDRQHVLFNVFEARSLTISNIAVQGTILAPRAEVVFPRGVISPMSLR